jgi:hypothetical protein
VYVFRESEQERQLVLELMKKQTPFKPKINASMSRDGDDEPHVPVFERLASIGDNKVLMNEVLSKIKTEIELRGCTFQPQMMTKKKQQPATPQPPEQPVRSIYPPILPGSSHLISFSTFFLSFYSGSREAEYGSRSGQSAAGKEGHAEVDRGSDELGPVVRTAAARPVHRDRQKKEPGAECDRRNGPSRRVCEAGQPMIGWNYFLNMSIF